MERRKAYMAFGITTLVLAIVVAGSALGLYLSMSFFKEASTGSTDSLDDMDDKRELGNNSVPEGNTFIQQNGSDIFGDRGGSPNIGGGNEGAVATQDGGSSEGGTPWPIYAMACAAVVLGLLFVSISGRAYMESARHESLVRNDLVDLISFNPGINLTSIRSELQLSQGAVSYHLRRLEKGGIIYSHKGMKERRYYPASMGFNQVERQSVMDEARSIIANPTGERIIDILQRGEATQSDIVKEIGVSPSTIHWHMERMEKAGIIRKMRAGRKVVYRLNASAADT